METGKKKVGLYLPIILADTLDQLTERVGKKQKWLIVGAALIRLLQTDERLQNELIRQVKIADLPGGSFENLIASARRGSTDKSDHANSDASRAANFQQLVAVETSDAPAAQAPKKKPPEKKPPATRRN